MSSRERIRRALKSMSVLELQRTQCIFKKVMGEDEAFKKSNVIPPSVWLTVIEEELLSRVNVC